MTARMIGLIQILVHQALLTENSEAEEDSILDNTI